jgi:adenosylcobinamide-GDP ribazoletransferase
VSTVRSAVALLTRFPVATADTEGPGAAAFGLVGALVGVAGAVPLAALAGPGQEPWLGAVAAVAVMAVVTGALHLDGLADTADALVARDPEAAERARKDPTLGVGGALAIGLVLAAQIAALVSLVTDAGAVIGALVLVGVATTSRIVPVAAASAVRRSPDDDPTLASWFTDRLALGDAAVAIGSSIGLVALLTIAGGSVIGIASIAAGILGLGAAGAIIGLRRGLDGDGMGAIVELSVVSGLAAAAVVLP